MITEIKSSLLKSTHLQRHQVYNLCSLIADTETFFDSAVDFGLRIAIGVGIAKSN